MNVHTQFDIAAATAAAAMTVGCFFWRLKDAATRIEHAGFGYALALVAGAVLGGYAAGTANLWLSGEPGVARSIVGALAGAIAAIEIFKRARGITGSTGIIFVPAFATSVAIGRWGCFYSGLADHTHGCPTTLSWGHDFGDHVPRHPVQLYESAAMTAFLAYALVMLARRDPFFMKNGFYLLVLWYATQRFGWEFLKPYAPVLGPLNLFHFVCLGLIAYATWMLRPDHACLFFRESQRKASHEPEHGIGFPSRMIRRSHHGTSGRGASPSALGAWTPAASWPCCCAAASRSRRSRSLRSAISRCLMA